MTSKIMIDELFDVVITDVDLVKSKLILLIEKEMASMNIKYSHNDKFNENEISINLDRIDNINKLSFKDRYILLKDVLKDIYKQISDIRKYKLITNNYYYSKYILNLAKKHISNNEDISRYIKKNKDVLLKYPILTLEYDINSGNKKNICELYNDSIVYKDKYNKELYYEIINDSLKHIEKEDKDNLMREFDSYELINYFEEIKEYNKRNKYNNLNVNNLISFLNDKKDDSENLYKTIYGDDTK